MTGTEIRLSYSLSGYDYVGASRVLLQRLLPVYQRHAFLVLPAIFVILPFALAFATRLGYPILGRYNWVFFAVIPLVMVAFIWQRDMITRDAIANAPSRGGITSLVINDEGVTFTTEAVRSTVFWKGIVDVLPSQDGLLVLCGGMEYFPIPARAFADKAEQQAVLQALRARSVHAREVTN